MKRLGFIHQDSLRRLYKLKSLHIEADVDNTWDAEFNQNHEYSLVIKSDSLEWLYLEGVEYNPDYMQYNLKKLETLELYKAKLNCNNLFSLDCFSTLKYLHLVASVTSNFKTELLAKASKLEGLRLVFVENIKIDSLTQRLFKNLVTLKYLSLKGLKLKKINRNLFKPLVNLEELTLSHNQIQRLENGTFKENVNLKMLDISFNRLDGLDFAQLLGHLNKLKEFNMSDNISYGYILWSSLANQMPPNLESFNYQSNFENNFLNFQIIFYFFKN